MLFGRYAEGRRVGFSPSSTLENGQRVVVERSDLTLFGNFYVIKTANKRMQVPEESIIIESGKAYICESIKKPERGFLEIRKLNINAKGIRTRSPQEIEVEIVIERGKKLYELIDSKGDQYYCIYTRYSRDLDGSNASLGYAGRSYSDYLPKPGERMEFFWVLSYGTNISRINRYQHKVVIEKVLACHHRGGNIYLVIGERKGRKIFAYLTFPQVRKSSKKQTN